MKNVILNKEVKEQMTQMEKAFGNGTGFDGEGKLLAINPTKEEFAEFNENFAIAVALGQTPDVLEGAVVYYDEAAGRAFVLGREEVEIVEVQ